MDPGADSLLIPLQPLGNVRAAVPVHKQQDTVIPLPQTDIVGVPIGTPHFVTAQVQGVVAV